MTARSRCLAIVTAAALLAPAVVASQKELLDAAQKGDIKNLSRLLQDDDVDLEGKNDAGDTALILAAREGHHRSAELLLDAGASFEATNKSGDTPMLVAAKQGHLRVVELLLTKEVKLDTANNAGDTALILAAQHRHADVAKRLIRKIEDVSVISLKNKEGRTALFWASRNGLGELERIIREKGGTQD
jgi:serine/threonine-protein phosphatase 6 regulatory ankyrin repeat subunit B